jgi:hypothetical protein
MYWGGCCQEAGLILQLGILLHGKRKTKLRLKIKVIAQKAVVKCTGQNREMFGHFCDLDNLPDFVCALAFVWAYHRMVPSDVDVL